MSERRVYSVTQLLGLRPPRQPVRQSLRTAPLPIPRRPSPSPTRSPPPGRLSNSFSSSPPPTSLLSHSYDAADLSRFQRPNPLPPPGFGPSRAKGAPAPSQKVLPQLSLHDRSDRRIARGPDLSANFASRIAFANSSPFTTPPTQSAVTHATLGLSNEIDRLFADDQPTHSRVATNCPNASTACPSAAQNVSLLDATNKHYVFASSPPFDHSTTLASGTSSIPIPSADADPSQHYVVHIDQNAQATLPLDAEGPAERHTPTLADAPSESEGDAHIMLRDIMSTAVSDPDHPDPREELSNQHHDVHSTLNDPHTDMSFDDFAQFVAAQTRQSRSPSTSQNGNSQKGNTENGNTQEWNTQRDSAVSAITSVNGANTINAAHTVNVANDANCDSAANTVTSVDSDSAANAANTVNATNAVDTVNTVNATGTVNDANTVNAVNAVKHNDAIRTGQAEQTQNISAMADERSDLGDTDAGGDKSVEALEKWFSSLAAAADVVESNDTEKQPENVIGTAAVGDAPAARDAAAAEEDRSLMDDRVCCFIDSVHRRAVSGDVSYVTADEVDGNGPFGLTVHFDVSDLTCETRVELDDDVAEQASQPLSDRHASSALSDMMTYISTMAS